MTTAMAMRQRQSAHRFSRVRRCRSMTGSPGQFGIYFASRKIGPMIGTPLDFNRSAAMRRVITALAVLTMMFIPPASAYADFTYVVQPGDTLAIISAKFDVPARAIINANHLNKAPDRIYAGQTLLIPSVASTASAASAAPAAGDFNPPETHSPESSTQPPVSYAAGAGATYVVQPGDTLAIISARFDVPARAIINANHLNKAPDRIYAGQTLVIPSVASTAS